MQIPIRVIFNLSTFTFTDILVYKSVVTEKLALFSYPKTTTCFLRMYIIATKIYDHYIFCCLRL